VSSIVWVNIALTVPFIAAFIGIPLWMTIRRPEAAADHSQARAYLAAKASRSARPAAAELATVSVDAGRRPEATPTWLSDDRAARSRAA
jgi:hypothetical protein